MEEILQQLIDFVREASPEVWRVLLRQVYVDACTDLLWLLMIAVLVYIVYRLGRRAERASLDEKGEYNERYSSSSQDSNRIAMYACYVIAGILAIVIPVLLTSALRAFLNPEYYAVMNIVNVLSQ